MSRPHRPSPASLTSDWPNVASSDPAAEKARLFAVSLGQALQGHSVRSVAAAADIDEATIRRVLAGSAWPDLRTIAMLETALGQPLYPH